MADGFRIGASWLDALDNYVEGLQNDAVAAVVDTAGFLQNAIVGNAMQKPEWVNLADNIQSWSEDGMLHIGLQDQAMVSSAFALEYGDVDNAPSPLFRTVDNITQEARRRMGDRLQQSRPVVIKGMRT